MVAPSRFHDPVCSSCLAKEFPSQNNQLWDPDNVGDDMQLCFLCGELTTDGLRVYNDRSKIDGDPPVFDEAAYYMSRHLDRD